MCTRRTCAGSRGTGSGWFARARQVHAPRVPRRAVPDPSVLPSVSFARTNPKYGESARQRHARIISTVMEVCSSVACIIIQAHRRRAGTTAVQNPRPADRAPRLTAAANQANTPQLRKAHMANNKERISRLEARDSRQGARRGKRTRLKRLAHNSSSRRIFLLSVAKGGGEPPSHPHRPALHPLLHNRPSFSPFVSGRAW